MNQQINLFNSLLFTEWATLVTLGICLLALQKHKKPTYPIYTRARYLLGIDFLLFALDPFLYWLTEEGICRIPQLGVISLGLYLVVAVLLSMTYIPFVQPDYITRKKVFLNILLLAGSLSALFSGAVTGGVFSLASRIAVTAVLLVTVCLFGIRFYSCYQKAQQKMDNFYADNFKQSITRLSSSVTLIVILGISSCSAPSLSALGNSHSQDALLSLSHLRVPVVHQLHVQCRFRRTGCRAAAGERKAQQKHHRETSAAYPALAGNARSPDKEHHNQRCLPPAGHQPRLSLTLSQHVSEHHLHRVDRTYPAQESQVAAGIRCHNDHGADCGGCRIHVGLGVQPLLQGA